ncbi:phosphoprotein [Wenzhou Myotis davidii paramyxovirus 1]|uniref:Phosphoprotein n=1 Tax=Wenzhou Myotis davidii paramyxovirus 1 TaxID=2928979 RepID=A0A8T9KLI1_9MONO|nr:phosphoprotein [Wenzhou Myotis davidii paramyxovirus 1]WPV62570.1 MAG: phosphoprotein [Wenzhou bat jeilongvirus 1]
MSTNTFKALIESVDNGLQIAQFVQENREELQKECGNSAINLSTKRPKKDSNQGALQTQSNNQNGPNIRGTALQGAEENGGSRYNLRSGQHSRDQTVPDPDLIQPTGDGNNQNRDAENNNDEDKGDGNELEWSDHSYVRGGDPDTEGNDELEGGSPVYAEGLLSFEGLDDDDGSDLEHPRPKRSMNIHDPDSIDESILDDIFNEGDSAQEKRLKSSGKLSEISNGFASGFDPIKKGTGESSRSMSSEEKPLSENGAIQSVQESGLNQSKKSAAVGNVPRDATTVSMMKIEGHQATNDELMSKIDSLITNQQVILDKLNTLSEVKEEIIGIKKTLNNFGLSLSTIESYINSLLIIIPKQGVEKDNQGKEINPDLKLVVGRDQRRGLMDNGVLTKKQTTTKFGEDIFDLDSFSNDMFLEQIDPSKNHAAKFVPDQSPMSIRIIKEIIKQRVKDDTIHRSLVEFIDQSAQKISAETIHKEILTMLDSVGL